MPDPHPSAPSPLEIRRPRLLFLAHRLPYPPDAGVSIRAFHTLRLLAKTFDVSLVAFHRAVSARERSELEGHVRALEAIVEDVSVHPIGQVGSRLRWVVDHARSTLLRRPYTEFLYSSKEFNRDLLCRLSSTAFDVVHMDSMDLASYLPALEGLPVVCAHHNVESALLRRRASVQKGWGRAAYLRFQAGMLERLERLWCPKVALNIVVSEDDRTLLLALAPSGSYTIVPNGVDDHKMQPAGAGDSGVVFVGGTTWFPNRDALEFFAEDILPIIRSKRPGVRAVWVGRSAKEEQAVYARMGIQLTGYVEDIRPYVGEAACFIVPLRVGGGTRLKILDAWAMGKAIVSTNIGAEGLRAVDEMNILLRDEPGAFADAVIDVLDNAELRKRLGAAGRAEVEQHYSWDSFQPEMLRSYTRAIAKYNAPVLGSTITQQTMPV